MKHFSLAGVQKSGASLRRVMTKEIRPEETKSYITKRKEEKVVFYHKKHSRERLERHISHKKEKRREMDLTRAARPHKASLQGPEKSLWCLTGGTESSAPERREIRHSTVEKEKIGRGWGGNVCHA